MGAAVDATTFEVEAHRSDDGAHEGFLLRFRNLAMLEGLIWLLTKVELLPQGDQSLPQWGEQVLEIRSTHARFVEISQSVPARLAILLQAIGFLLLQRDHLLKPWLELGKVRRAAGARPGLLGATFGCREFGDKLARQFGGAVIVTLHFAHGRLLWFVVRRRP